MHHIEGVFRAGGGQRFGQDHTAPSDNRTALRTDGYDYRTGGPVLLSPKHGAIPEHLDDFYSALYKGDSEVGKLAGLFSMEDDWPWRWETLSHGERKRAQIAAALYTQPEVLALDEPSNHLDEEAQGFLLQGLKTFSGIALVVSHDRPFLDLLCSSCLFIEDGAVIQRPGNLSQALVQKQREEKERLRIFEVRQKKLSQLKEQAQLQREKADRHRKDFSKRGIGAKDHDARFRIDGLRLAGKDAIGGRLSKAMERRADQTEKRLNTIDKPAYRKTGISFSAPLPGAKRIVRLLPGTLILSEERSLIYPELTIDRGDHISLEGPNGVGKTSLVREILRTHETKRREWLYLAQELSGTEIDRMVSFFRELDNERKGELLSRFSRLNGDPDVCSEIGSMSAGELRKMYLAMGLLEETGFLILDEPTNHLDLPSRMAIEAALSEWPGALLVISHDQAFRRKLSSRRWVIDSGCLNIFLE